jgi:hypothetical protein
VEGVPVTVDDELVTDRLVRLVAIVLFLKAAGLLVLAGSAAVRPVPGRVLVVTVVLAAAMVAAAIGLLRSRRWAWPLAFVTLVADAVIIGGILRLLIDVGVALVLFQPRVRARFGMR